MTTAPPAAASAYAKAAFETADGSRGLTIGLVLVTLAGLLLRLVYLNQPMRYDESFSYLFFVRVPLSTTISDYSLPNQHILNSLLMRLSAMVFGDAPWSLRLPAFVFGVAIIPATFFALRRLFGPDAAFLAAAFTAVSSPLIVYSTNARGYSLVALLFLGILAASQAIARTGSRKAWRWLAAFSVLGLYTIPVMLYAIGGVYIWHAARAWSSAREGDGTALKQVMLTAIVVAVLTVLLYVPVLLASGLGPLIANDWVASLPAREFVGELPAALGRLWESWHVGMPKPLAVLLAIGVAAYALLPQARRTSASLVAAILLWCLALLLITMRPPFPRVWLFLLPLYFAVASAGMVAALAFVAPNSKRAAAMIAALIVCTWSSYSVIHSGVVLETEGPLFPDAEAVVTYLGTDVRPGDGVYVRTPADAPLWYYTWQRGLPDAMLRLKYNASQRVLVVVNEADDQQIEGILAVTPLGSGQFSPPLLRRSFKSSRVYEVQRRTIP